MLEKIAMDYKGTFSARSVHGNNGFYLISDYKSVGVWGYPVSEKGEIIAKPILENFISKVARENNYKLFNVIMTLYYLT